jgi:hypothetical protein
MMCGRDPDYAKRDLFEHIEKGGDARWTLNVQVMTPEEVLSISHLSLRHPHTLFIGYHCRLRPLRRDQGLAPLQVPDASRRRASAQPQPGGLSP